LSGCFRLSEIEGKSCPLLSSVILTNTAVSQIDLSGSAIEEFDLSAHSSAWKLYLNDCPNLTSITFGSITAREKLRYLEISNCPVTSINLNGSVLFDRLLANGCALINTDSIFNDLASAGVYSGTGIIDVSGGTNASVTAASDASRSFLTTGGKTWTLTYNS
jgi:hypothetical protein